METFYIDENGDIVYSGDSESDISDYESDNSSESEELYSDQLEEIADEILTESESEDDSSSGTADDNEIESGDNDVSVYDDDDVAVSEDNILQDTELSESEIQEILDTISNYSDSDSDDISLASLSYDDLVTAVADGVLTAEGASGTLSSSTLDVFDRIVSGLNSNIGYIAYRIDSSDSTAGVLIYSDDYDVDGTEVYIDGTSISVYRVNTSSSGSSNYITYIDYDSGYYFEGDISEDSSIIYYTNLVDGYPVLGGYGSVNTFNYAGFIVVAMVAVVANIVLTKLFNRHKA